MVQIEQRKEALMKLTHDRAAYVTISELAREVGVHRNTIHYWIKLGIVEAKRIGIAPKSPLLITRAEAERVKAELQGNEVK